MHALCDRFSFMNADSDAVESSSAAVYLTAMKPRSNILQLETSCQPWSSALSKRIMVEKSVPNVLSGVEGTDDGIDISCYPKLRTSGECELRNTHVQY